MLVFLQVNPVNSTLFGKNWEYWIEKLHHIKTNYSVKSFWILKVMSYQSVKKLFFSAVHFYIYCDIFFAQKELLFCFSFAQKCYQYFVFSVYVYVLLDNENSAAETQSLYKLGKLVKIHMISRYSHSHSSSTY